MKAIESGFDVEIDVWFKNDKFYLCHDKPCFEVDTKFLKNLKLLKNFHIPFKS